MQMIRQAARKQKPALLSKRQAERVIAHIETRFAERIHLAELAAVAHVSVGHFCRAFKGTFGQRPRSYVMHRRVAHAKHLMVFTSAPLSQVALACGMVDQPHFSRVFRQLTGMTPGAWRRSNSAENMPAYRFDAMNIAVDANASDTAHQVRVSVGSIQAPPPCEATGTGCLA
jgi:AraC-like DNA-binding protein